MAKQQKFTFKTERPTGKWRSFEKSFHRIKFNGKKVGRIIDRTWEIRLMIVKTDYNDDKTLNCPWRWIVFKYKPTSLEDAKEWLNNNIQSIMLKYTLSPLEN